MKNPTALGEELAPPPADGRCRNLALWAELAEHACEPNVFYHPALLVPALEHLDRHGGVRVLEAFDGDLLIGLLPVEQASRHGRFPFANIVNLTHAHCFLGTPLLRAGHEMRAWALLLEQLDRAPWAGLFLHLTGQTADGPAMAALTDLCAAQKRERRLLQRYERALLHSDLDADSYWQTHVRAKKRKELRRLVNRLEEAGTVARRRLTGADDLAPWCAAFLTLEASGWKGRKGSALASEPRSRTFFRAICANAFAADMLDMLRIDLDGRPIAMLVNLRHLDGAFSFKIAIDEAFGRFSPGVLIEQDNLGLVCADPRIGWMDSCAVADHSMIDSLWAERRAIAQYRVALRGPHGRRPARALAMRVTATVEAILKTARRQRGP